MDASQDAAAAVHVVVHPVGRQVSPSDVEPMHREVVGMASLPSSVRAAREVIRRVLDSLDPERAERAAVCGSELVANAVRHGAPPIVLSVVRGSEDIVIAVADGSREPPRPRTALDDDPTGRGTLIIDRLADRWGVDFLPGGKQVWCRISLGAEDRMVRA
jgi:anti-sigma regulatory factor (Ser/Thr protein kinase)